MELTLALSAGVLSLALLVYRQAREREAWQEERRELSRMVFAGRQREFDLMRARDERDRTEDAVGAAEEMLMREEEANKLKVSVGNPRRFKRYRNG